jgi:circadian clock protein KaiC
VVVIDSLSGYLNALPEDRQLAGRLHELLAYLSANGILTIMIVNRFGSADNIEHEIDASYIADTVILLRHFEAEGEIRRCIAVLKKRHGEHEHTIREFKIASGGCQVGQPLTKFRGVLTGNPVYTGRTEALLE